MKHIKYTGPAKPISLEFKHPLDNRATRIVVLVFCIGVLLLDLFYWRPY